MISENSLHNQRLHKCLSWSKRHITTITWPSCQNLIYSVRKIYKNVNEKLDFIDMTHTDYDEIIHTHKKFIPLAEIFFCDKREKVIDIFMWENSGLLLRQ